MTRRSHIVRTDSDTGAGSPRSIGGCTVLCANQPGWHDIEPGTRLQACELAIDSGVDYRRVFLSATVNLMDIEDDEGNFFLPGQLTVDLHADADVISKVNVPSGDPACISAVADLSAGHHTIYLEIYPSEPDKKGFVASLFLQAIVGQAVSERGCGFPNGGGDE